MISVRNHLQPSNGNDVKTPKLGVSTPDNENVETPKLGVSTEKNEKYHQNENT